MVRKEHYPSLGKVVFISAMVLAIFPASTLGLLRLRNFGHDTQFQATTHLLRKCS
jgi:hypothetical protein